MIELIIVGMYVLQLAATLAAIAIALRAAWHLGVKRLLSGQ